MSDCSATEAARFEHLGRLLAQRVRVIVHGYPCCAQVVRGRIGADGFVVLDDNTGHELQILMRQHRIEIKS